MRGNLVPRAVLHHWWLCGRKRAYSTRTVAELALRAAAEALGPEAASLHPYACPIGHHQQSPHFHVGHLKRVPYPQRPSQMRRAAITSWNWNVHKSPRSGWIRS